MDTLTQLPHTPGDNIYMILAFLVATYELVARFVPTVKDFTILGFLYRFLDYIVENRAKDETPQNSDPAEKPRFKISRIFNRKK
jgi:hypothetical protein